MEANKFVVSILEVMFVNEFLTLSISAVIPEKYTVRRISTFRAKVIRLQRRAERIITRCNNSMRPYRL